ncbi:MAG: hypothetical protein DME25_10655, partial [Verrucomicrobia bacterium]
MNQTPEADSPGDGKISRRDLLRGAIALGAGAALSGCGTGRATQNLKLKTKDSSNLVRRENERPGSRDWMLERTRIDPATKYRCPWIEGYCSRTSARAGEKMSFHVST